MRPRFPVLGLRYSPVYVAALSATACRRASGWESLAEQLGADRVSKTIRAFCMVRRYMEYPVQELGSAYCRRVKPQDEGVG